MGWAEGTAHRASTSPTPGKLKQAETHIDRIWVMIPLPNMFSAAG